MGQKGVFHLFLAYFFSKIASEFEKYFEIFQKFFRILKEDRILAPKTTFLGHFEDHPVSRKAQFGFGGVCVCVCVCEVGKYMGVWYGFQSLCNCLLGVDIGDLSI